MLKVLKTAFRDIQQGWNLRQLWIALANEDITDQHRRTSLGPIWLLINYLLFVGTMMLIFGGNPPIKNFIAYISVGLLIYQLLQEILNTGASIYVREEAFITGTPLPMSVYIFRATMQSLIRFGYAAAGCIAILVLAETPVSLTWLWSFVGFALIVVVTPPLMIVLGTLGAFVPDIQFVISNLMRVGMFLTPIFWHSTTGARGHLSRMNPLTHFINIVRTPIVEGSVPFHSFAICSAIVVGLWILAVFLLGKYHKKIVFWIS